MEIRALRELDSCLNEKKQQKNLHDTFSSEL